MGCGLGSFGIRDQAGMPVLVFTYGREILAEIPAHPKSSVPQVQGQFRRECPIPTTRFPESVQSCTTRVLRFWRNPIADSQISEYLNSDLKRQVISWLHPTPTTCIWFRLGRETSSTARCGCIDVTSSP